MGTSGGTGTGQPAGAARRLITRRTFLRAGAAAGVAGALGGRLASGLSAAHGRLIDTALASASGGSLSDIRHVVILMQENRSFDHYFGTMERVRGYTDTGSYSSYAGGPRTDPTTVFQQTMMGTTLGGQSVDYMVDQLGGGGTDTQKYLSPFELVSNPPTVAGQTTNDITHDWGPQHGAWNNGAMDHFMVEHLANDPLAKWQFTTTDGIPLPTTSTVPTGITAMGYYRRSDCLAFYRALADAFTICDGYHCSVLGPTDPNRVMWMSGSLGAHSGDVGGPVLETYVTNRPQLYGTLEWPTIPEVLTAHDVSWKVYQDPTSQTLFNVLTYFKNFFKPSTPTDVRNAALGLAPVYPTEFQADVAAGTLSQVSWIMPPAFACEHPAVPPEYGEWLVAQVLQTLVSNPDVWQHTVLLVVYDENGGFFDHVPPPTPGPTVTTTNDVAPPTGSLSSLAGSNYDGEYVTSPDPTNAAGGPPSDWYGVLGPVGLGFRTPALVVSPFSAGGWVSSDTFDHISTIKLIETLFLPKGTVQGPDGLHVSPWRYDTVGDLTSALPLLQSPDPQVPELPPTSLLFPQTAEEALLNSLAGTDDYAQAYPPPTSNTDAYLTQDPEPAGFTRKQIPPS
jgi:phospholipase C